MSTRIADSLAPLAGNHVARDAVRLKETAVEACAALEGTLSSCFHLTAYSLKSDFDTKELLLQ
jgi:hypothetical protein